MLQLEFDTQIARAKSAFPKMATGVIDEIQRRWIALDTLLFSRMVTWVIDHSRYNPVPKDFYEAHSQISDTYRQENQGPVCRECNGLAFVTVYALIYDEPKQLAKPCPSCNRYKPKVREHGQPADQIQITRDEYLKRRAIPITQNDPDVERMGPHGSAFLIEMMDQFGTHEMPEEAIKALTYKAAMHRKAECPACRRGSSPSVAAAVKTLGTAFE